MCIFLHRKNFWEETGTTKSYTFHLQRIYFIVCTCLGATTDQGATPQYKKFSRHPYNHSKWQDFSLPSFPQTKVLHVKTENDAKAWKPSFTKKKKQTNKRGEQWEEELIRDKRNEEKALMTRWPSVQGFDKNSSKGIPRQARKKWNRKLSGKKKRWPNTLEAEVAYLRLWLSSSTDPSPTRDSSRPTFSPLSSSCPARQPTSHKLWPRHNPENSLPAPGPGDTAAPVAPPEGSGRPEISPLRKQARASQVREQHARRAAEPALTSPPTRGRNSAPPRAARPGSACRVSRRPAARSLSAGPWLPASVVVLPALAGTPAASGAAAAAPEAPRATPRPRPPAASLRERSESSQPSLLSRQAPPTRKARSNAARAYPAPLPGFSRSPVAPAVPHAWGAPAAGSAPFPLRRPAPPPPPALAPLGSGKQNLLESNVRLSLALPF